MKLEMYKILLDVDNGELTPEQAQAELLGLFDVRLSLPTHKESVEACNNSKFDKTSIDKDSWNSGKVAGWNECYFWILNLLKGNEA